MRNKFVHCLEILKNNNKVVLCNLGTTGWLKISEEVYEIIKLILEKGYDIEDLRDSFESDEDYNFIKNTYNDLVKMGFIVNREIELANGLACIELTHRCNLHCSHCCIDAETTADEEMDLSTEQVKAIFDKIIKWEPIAIQVSGGEPLIRKDFFQLIEYLRTNFKGRIILCTNGLLINKDNVDKLCSMVDQIDISLDGVDEETTSLIRGKGVFGRVIQVVALIKNTGFKNISLSMAVPGKGIGYEEKFKELNERLETTPLIREYMPIGRAVKDKEKILKTFGVRAYTTEELEKNITSDLELGVCSAGKREIFIDHKGDIYPCANFIKEDCFLGNIFEISDIGELLNKSKINKYVSDGVAKYDPKNSDKCKECVVNVFCCTCPHYSAFLKQENLLDEHCKKVKPILMKHIWGE